MTTKKAKMAVYKIAEAEKEGNENEGDDDCEE